MPPATASATLSSMETGLDSSEVLATLESILSTPHFRRSPRHSSVLRHLVTHTLNGESGNLREYDLGVDCFNRGQNFDPRTDTIVRVELTRLRARLEQYYAEEGKGLPIHISLPRGSVPVFNLKSREAPEGAPRLVPASRKRVFAWPLAASLSILAGAATIAIYQRSTDPLKRKELAQITTAQSGVFNPVVSRNGQVVAFAHDRDANDHLEIWTKRLANDAEPVRLTRGEVNCDLPHLSPDGSLVAFAKRSGEGGIFLSPLNGGVPRQIVPRGSRPRFSNRGNQLAYEAGPIGGSSGTELHIIPVDGSKAAARIQPKFRTGVHPVWLEGDRALLVWGYAEDPKDIDWWVLPLDGSDAIRTGAYALAKAKGVTVGPATDWWNGYAYFRVQQGDSNNIWRAPLQAPEYHLGADFERLTFGSGREEAATVTARGEVVFANVNRMFPVLSASIHQQGKQVADSVVPIAREENAAWGSSVTADESRMVYAAQVKDHVEIRVQELMDSRKNWTVYSAKATAETAVISPDGRFAAFTIREPEPRRIVIAGLESGKTVAECLKCGDAVQLGPDFALVRTSRGLALWNWHGAGPPKDILAAHLADHAGAAMSPNSRLAAFSLVVKPGFNRLRIAPIGDAGSSSMGSWTQPGDDLGNEYNPVFRFDGGAVWFVSERDGGGRCIFERTIDPLNGRPSRTLREIAHFHRPSRTTLWGWPSLVGLAGGKDHLFVRAKEEQATIWMLR